MFCDDTSLWVLYLNKLVFLRECPFATLGSSLSSNQFCLEDGQLKLYSDQDDLSQARSHGGHSGAVPPEFLLCPPKFCCAQKNLFWTYSKLKILPPQKCVVPHQILKPGYWLDLSYRVTQKNGHHQNRITSKILFRLTQNFSYIRSSLCSRHHQSFKSDLQKLFVSLALKKCAPNELPGAAGAFASGGQSSRWPSLGIALIAAVIAAFRSGIVW